MAIPGGSEAPKQCVDTFTPPKDCAAAVTGVESHVLRELFQSTSAAGASKVHVVMESKLKLRGP